MKPIKIQIEHESFEKQNKARRFHPALELTFWDHCGKAHIHTLYAGNSDTICGYQDNDEVLILNRNENMGSYGLQVFKLDKNEEVGDVFITDLEVKDILGKATSDVTIIKRLRERIDQ